MRSVFLVRLLGLIGLKVPDTVAIRVSEFCLAAFLPIWFSDDIAALIRQPFSLTDTFSVQMVGENFVIRKTPTETSGHFNVFFCQQEGTMTQMGLAHSGVFTRREEDFALAVDTAGFTLSRSKPVAFVTSIEPDTEESSIWWIFNSTTQVSSIEVFDPSVKRRTYTQEKEGLMMECPASLDLSELQNENGS